MYECGEAERAVISERQWADARLTPCAEQVLAMDL